MEQGQNIAPNDAFFLADGSSERGEQNTKEKRLSRYSTARRKTLSHLKYIKRNHPEEERLQEKLSGCCRYLTFKQYSDANIAPTLHNMITCKKHLLCPMCAIFRGAKSVQAYMEKLNFVINEKPTLKPYMVTLTVKNSDDLKKTINHLKKSTQYLYKRRFLKTVESEVRSSKCAGAVWSYEIKRGKNSEKWHPHAHAIWLCETPPDAQELSKEWKKITGDSHIVDVRPLRGEMVDGKATNELAKSLCEVFKYAIKFSDQPAKDTFECYKTLQKTRLLGSMGVLYGVKIPDDEDIQKESIEPYIELYYKFTRGIYKLKKSRLCFAEDQKTEWEDDPDYYSIKPESEPSTIIEKPPP